MIEYTILRALSIENATNLNMWDELKDFKFVEDNEILIRGNICTTISRRDECGCDRSMSGTTTKKGTTIFYIDFIDYEDIFHVWEHSEYAKGYNMDFNHFIKLVHFPEFTQHEGYTALKVKHVSQDEEGEIIQDFEFVYNGSEKLCM